MTRTTCNVHVLGLVAFFGLATAGTGSPSETVRFNRDVRPILSQNCFSCHGPAKQMGGLRLDSIDAATRTLKSKTIAIVPGKPEASELVKRIQAADPDEAMPPASSHKTLTADQKETLRRWVIQGADYEPHWSFAKLKSPPVPAAGPENHNPIDAFLNERLSKVGLTPNPTADRPTLIRRLSFALTGLPPNSAEVDAFLADATPGAYERLVERYLNSPRFGEEMARHWLDLARYADTHGLHLDNVRSMWPYRDWVVHSFNSNKPFDRFTVEQVAGDLIPQATPDQIVATGFNRCNVTTGEGGSIDAEWYFRNAVDRAAVTAGTWLGLTAGCAVCHDHKFDPLTQREFYGLYAFFYSSAGPALDGNIPAPEPSLKITSAGQAKQLAVLAERIAALNAEIDVKAKGLKYSDPADIALLGSAIAATADVTKSFRAWTRSRGGPLKDKVPQEIKNIFAVTDGKWSPAQQAKLREFYLHAVCAATKGTFAPLIAERDQLTAERTRLDAAIPATMIFRDMPTPRDAFVMARGQYDKPGDKVAPGVPAALPPMKPAGTRANRLDLANWLVSPDNPLTARVFVNRVWQQMFGTGLVKTSGDFGSQGEPPSHPELLDWLAADFRDSGWDIKALVRRLVTTAAFQRSAKFTPAIQARDPENRLLARGPRFRLDAEQVRDNALAVSGLLVPTVGGPGVRPYQPDNIWEPVGFTGSNTQHYKRDTGSDLYRRTLYTFFKRTAPPPYMANFDAPNREQSCSRRDRSNTPLQALQLMNDVQHIEAARALAERMLTEGGTTTVGRIQFAFRLVLARPPEPAELDIIVAELNAHVARYVKAPDDAKKLIALGESKPNAKLDPTGLAAYIMIANMLLNLDETVTRN